MQKILYMWYIRNMLNVANDPSAEGRWRFIEDFGRYFGQWGLGPTLGRIWAYLLLCPEPASLDLIAADLGISKSNASVTTRQLEQFLLARRSGKPGSRRALYEANPMSRRFFDQILGSYGELTRFLESGVVVSPDGTVRARLEEAVGFFHSWIEEFEKLIHRLEGAGRLQAARR